MDKNGTQTLAPRRPGGTKSPLDTRPPSGCCQQSIDSAKLLGRAAVPSPLGDSCLTTCPGPRLTDSTSPFSTLCWFWISYSPFLTAPLHLCTFASKQLRCCLLEVDRRRLDFLKRRTPQSTFLTSSGGEKPERLGDLSASVRREGSCTQRVRPADCWGLTQG